MEEKEGGFPGSENAIIKDSPQIQACLGKS